jgi:hypothetical protein
MAGSHLCGVDSAMDSQIDVNGTRWTSCAGNADDGVSTVANGNLFTVGGLDDSNDNPADPFQRAADGETPRVLDDELYNLKPFVNTGDTLINVNTINPSNDDNIFVAYFRTSVPSVVGEGIVLGPLAATNAIGASHTVTATVVDDAGAPVAGRSVSFMVESGPNAGASGSAATNASGQASFSYVGASTGTDTVVATMTDSHGMLKTSNEVTKLWVVFDPFGGLVRTPRRDISLHLVRPSPDTDGVRCVETSDPANPDFDSIPFTPFPNGSVDIDIVLSEGDGTKTVCCDYHNINGVISEPICDSIELQTGPVAPPAAAAPALSWPALVLATVLLGLAGRRRLRGRAGPV